MGVYESVGIGSDFLGYRIEELIGRGGMGVVYRAYDLRLKRPVALKLVAPALAEDERFRERFARESELVMSLEHPNVVPIYDAGDVDSRVYLAMRLVDGTDLGTLLRREGSLAPALAMAICTQMAAALDAAHARGLVHRDVKPSNVLLDNFGHVYLADFGLTRRFDDEGPSFGEDHIVGTPAYLAPEQLEGGPVDARTDIYALGCVLFECLTGEPVFVRGSRLAVAWAHLEEEPPLASRRRAGLLEAIDAVIASALAKEPAERYDTCGELVAAADRALGLAKSGPSRRRQTLILAGAVCLAIGLTVGLIETLGHGGQHKATTPLFARANTLARIDPATNKVSAVINVPTNPVITAAGGNTVWGFSRGQPGEIWQIDAETNHLVDTTQVKIQPDRCCGLFTGPVLAANASGAWFIEGGFAGTKPLLVHVPVGRRGHTDYPLPVTPTGVAVGGGAVWVVGHEPRGDKVLRINPTSGRVSETFQFPLSARIDSIAFGYRATWVVSSATADLYKIDARSHRKTRLHVGQPSATRPEIVPSIGKIFVRTTSGGGIDYTVNPSPLTLDYQSPPHGPPGNFEDEGQYGSLWWYVAQSGDVEREPVTGGPISNTINVTQAAAVLGSGPCLTSITTGARSLWVTAAPSSSVAACTR
jgi:serine/threonine-protein kinase